MDRTPVERDAMTFLQASGDLLGTVAGNGRVRSQLSDQRNDISRRFVR
jgi:hypothetical protein